MEGNHSQNGNTPGHVNPKYPVIHLNIFLQKLFIIYIKCLVSPARDKELDFEIPLPSK